MSPNGGVGELKKVSHKESKTRDRTSIINNVKLVDKKSEVIYCPHLSSTRYHLIPENFEHKLHSEYKNE